jgi:hypothetical protein
VQKFPPIVAQGWLIYLASAAVIASVDASFARGRVARVIIAIVSAILLAVTAALLIRPRTLEQSADIFASMLGSFAAGMILWWAAMEFLAARAPGPGVPLLLAVCAAGAAAALVNSATLSLGLICGAISVTLAVVALLAFYFRNLSLARGGMLVIAIALLGLVFCGHLYADMTRRDMNLLWAAPLAMWVGEVPAIRSNRWMRFGVGAVAVLVVLAIPVVPAVKGLVQTMREQTESYQY